MRLFGDAAKRKVDYHPPVRIYGDNSPGERKLVEVSKKVSNFFKGNELWYILDEPATELWKKGYSAANAISDVNKGITNAIKKFVPEIKAAFTLIKKEFEAYDKYFKEHPDEKDAYENYRMSQ